MQDKMFSLKEGKSIDIPAHIKSFLADINEVCKKHGVSISHEDHHGSFILEPYSEQLSDWLNEATLNDK